MQGLGQDPQWKFDLAFMRELLALLQDPVLSATSKQEHLEDRILKRKIAHGGTLVLNDGSTAKVTAEMIDTAVELTVEVVRAFQYEMPSEAVCEWLDQNLALAFEHLQVRGHRFPQFSDGVISHILSLLAEQYPSTKTWSREELTTLFASEVLGEIERNLKDAKRSTRKLHEISQSRLKEPLTLLQLGLVESPLGYVIRSIKVSKAEQPHEERLTGDGVLNKLHQILNAEHSPVIVLSPTMIAVEPATLTLLYPSKPRHRVAQKDFGSRKEALEIVLRALVELLKAQSARADVEIDDTDLLPGREIEPKNQRVGSYTNDVNKGLMALGLEKAELVFLRRGGYEQSIYRFTCPYRIVWIEPVPSNTVFESRLLQIGLED